MRIKPIKQTVEEKNMKVTDIQVDVVFILIIGSVCCIQTCVLPQPGKCSSDNYSVDGNEVCELNAGSCDFNSTSGLCLYQQGCADPYMSNWTLAGDHVQAGQEEAGACPSSDYYYSVLESPWLNVTHLSCLKFTYLRLAPAALDVFLDQQDEGISTVLNRSNDNTADNERTDVKRNVDPGFRKVIFRAYGGGGGRVKVFSVSVDPGLCTCPEYRRDVLLQQRGEAISPQPATSKHTMLHSISSCQYKSCIFTTNIHCIGGRH
ncbi:uncharacterized protein LOC143301552 [Babylonia areolata]|uniref:uncharacterized protein LOC143301552 n=1 Tax=Babylonia areolata TaxID=304850 RepID=UPI003FD174DD